MESYVTCSRGLCVQTYATVSCTTWAALAWHITSMDKNSSQGVKSQKSGGNNMCHTYSQMFQGKVRNASVLFRTLATTLFFEENWLQTKLTEVTMDGRPHSVLRSLLLCRRPCLSILLSKTSTPNTLGFIGLGYFCMAALVTVSQGWLSEEKRKQHRECCYDTVVTRASTRHLYDHLKNKMSCAFTNQKGTH